MTKRVKSPQSRSPLTPVRVLKVSIGNMQTQHGFELLPATWVGKPDFFSQGTVVNQSVLRRLGLFGESGAVLAKLYEFEWCVGDGPLFLHMVQGPEWTSLVMSDQQVAALLFADPEHAIDLCDEHDDDTPVSVSSKKQRAAKELLALQAGADASTADTTGGGGGGGGDGGRPGRAAKRNKSGDEDTAQARAFWAAEAADPASFPSFKIVLS